MKHYLLAAGLGLATAAAAQTTSPTLPPAVDYASDASWLCRPGRADACSAPLEITSVAANGQLTRSLLTAAKNPATDCFYIYPTVSTDPGPNSDMIADAAERNVAAIQFAPFRSACRTYAPLYRQATLAALRGALAAGRSVAPQWAIAYRDVATAWASYLARDNGGRGVILIGHSQGSGMLKMLIQQEIEGKPVASRIIAAYLPGSNVLVPAGADAGGDFKLMPLCHGATQTGCIIAYVSFRDGSIPPPDTRFGRTTVAGMSVACTNPAALAGGRGALQPLLPNRRDVVDNASPQPEWSKGAAITTAFVALPGLLSAECTSLDNATYLAVRTTADPADPRTDQIGGDVVYNGRLQPESGLHLIDVNVAATNLVDLARSQSTAWLAQYQATLERRVPGAMPR